MRRVSNASSDSDGVSSGVISNEAPPGVNTPSRAALRAGRPAILLVDVPDTNATLRKANGGQRLPAGDRLSLRRLVQYAAQRSPVVGRLLLTNRRPPVSAAQLAEFEKRLAEIDWRVVVASDEFPGEADYPVINFLNFWFEFERLAAPAPNDIIVVTHRPEVANVLERCMASGLRVTIVGLLGYFHPSLANLADRYPQRCRLVDLDIDCKAVVIPDRWGHGARHPFPDQLISNT